MAPRRSRGRRSRSATPGLAALLALGAVLLLLAERVWQASASAPLVAAGGLGLAVAGGAALVWYIAARRRRRARTLAELLACTPAQFEDLTARLLKDLGFEDVRRTGGAGDLNVDIRARDPGGSTVAVQCKRYGVGHNVGSPEVQTFIGMLFRHHGAERGIFVTTSSFTAPATALAGQHGIELWTGEHLVRLLTAPRKPGRPDKRTRYR